MHVLKPKQTKLKPEEVKKLLAKYNISLSQLPKMRKDDSVLSEDVVVGDVFKFERTEDDGKLVTYYRVVVE